MTSLTQTRDGRGTTRSDNARLAVDFMKAASDGRAREAMRRVAAPGFIHHNPYFASGAETLATAMDEDARANPDKVLEIQRTIEEGPFVAVHSRLRQPGRPDLATVHIFRIEDGRIHELWDVVQESPAESPNQDGMF
jgi:predicted SnoaL-like aldol condensation-catalyzing enzyme